MYKLIIIFASAFIFVSALQAESNIPSGKQLQAQSEKVTRIIDTPSLKKLIDEEPDLVLVDIRTPTEIKRHGGTIDVPQNVLIPRGWLEFDIQQKVASNNSPIVVYCGGGLRSPLAAETLQNMGYTNVWNYSDGYFGWKKSQ